MLCRSRVQPFLGEERRLDLRKRRKSSLQLVEMIKKKKTESETANSCKISQAHDAYGS